MFDRLLSKDTAALVLHITIQMAYDALGRFQHVFKSFHAVVRARQAKEKADARRVAVVDGFLIECARLHQIRHAELHWPFAKIVLMPGEHRHFTELHSAGFHQFA